MNFRTSRIMTLATFSLITLGMVSAPMAQATKTVLPSVSAKLGVAPVIGKPSGPAPTKLTIKDIVVGKGKTALPTSTVTVQYVLASWVNGKVLQSSWTSQAFTDPLSSLVIGWQKGIPGMKVGGRRLLVTPPAYAYGAAGAGAGSGIGPNATLVFVVDLLGVK